MKGHLIDTNVIMRYPSALTHFENVVVHLGTIEELDYLKESANSEVAYRARKGAKAVAQNLDHIKIEQKKYGLKVVDDILWKCAKNNNYVLITNDLTLQLKAKFHRVKTNPYKNGEDKLYTGVETVFITDESTIPQIAKEMMQDLYENQYLVFKNTNKPFLAKDGSEDYSSVEIFVKQKGELVPVVAKTINNSIYRKITARNPEQKCLIDALFNDDITILCVNGKYGVGKSHLTINYAFQQLERGAIAKIVYVPNNSTVANSRDIGALPGNLLEKEIIHMGTLVDIVGQQEIEKRIMEGSLELMPISFARGRNIENSIILVNEAQNLTEEHVKLLIGRIGDGTKVIFDGDIHQSDKSVFKSSSGLKMLQKIKDSKFADLFAIITLKSIERSRTAMVSDFLDKIE